MHVLKSGRAQKAVHVHLKNGGEKVYVETKAYPVKDQDGEIRFVIEIISDISDRYKLQIELEQKVKELQEFYDMAVERELKMIELKKEIEHLRKQLNSRQ
jgi:cell shape-determining protein MreC